MSAQLSSFHPFPFSLHQPDYPQLLWNSLAGSGPVPWHQLTGAQQIRSGLWMLRPGHVALPLPKPNWASGKSVKSKQQILTGASRIHVQIEGAQQNHNTADGTRIVLHHLGTQGMEICLLCGRT